MKDDLIYLDYNATTPVLPEVVTAMIPYWSEIYGNPSSSHQPGRMAREALDKARAEVAALLGVTPDWVIFTGGATEANNLALLGAARAQPAGKRHLIVSAIEHPAIIEPAKALQREGWELSIAPVDRYGVVCMDEFERLLRPDTALVSIMYANNEIGTIQPLSEITRLTKPRGIVLHADAAQSVGKIPTRIDELGVDMLSLTGHKFYGPKGVGALVRNPALKLTPVDFGAGHESGLRPGTENVPLIAGLGTAARLAKETLEQRRWHMQAIRDRLQDALREALPGLQVNGHPTQRLPNTLNVSFPNIDARAMLARLSDSVAASAGSACHSNGHGTSGVLGAIGASVEQAAGAIRLSVGIETTAHDIDQAAKRLIAAATHTVR